MKPSKLSLLPRLHFKCSSCVSCSVNTKNNFVVIKTKLDIFKEYVLSIDPRPAVEYTQYL